MAGLLTMGDDNSPSNLPVNETKIVEEEELFTKSEALLDERVIDENKGISMLDVYYVVARLDEDFYSNDYLFYAMQDEKSDSYIAAIKTPLGTALLLVPSEATSISSKSELEKRVLAINGTAKDLINSNLDFATGYNPAEILKLVQ